MCGSDVNPHHPDSLPEGGKGLLSVFVTAGAGQAVEFHVHWCRNGWWVSPKSSVAELSSSPHARVYVSLACCCFKPVGFSTGHGAIVQLEAVQYQLENQVRCKTKNPLKIPNPQIMTFTLYVFLLDSVAAQDFRKPRNPSSFPNVWSTAPFQS